MSRYVIGTLLTVLILSGGCAARAVERVQSAASPGYQLILPPAVADKGYPGGFHVQSDAPVASWHQVAAFATRDACESSRIARIDDSIDKARIEVGDRAKYQLPVRRAVRARCVVAR